jgi:hypothetical protein
MMALAFTVFFVSLAFAWVMASACLQMVVGLLTRGHYNVTDADRGSVVDGVVGFRSSTIAR